MSNFICRASLSKLSLFRFLVLPSVLTFVLGAGFTSSALGGEPPKSNQQQKVESLEELRLAFSKGLIPDPKSPDQLKAFSVYLRIGFGDPRTDLGDGNLVEQIADELIQNPNLIEDTPQFRNYTLTTQDRNYPVTPELSNFLDPQMKSARAKLGELFQVRDNQVYWSKVLGFQGQKSEQLAFISQHIPEDVQGKLSDKNFSAVERARILYPVLKSARAKLKKNGADAGPITQAMIDLLHSTGLADASIAEGLKSQDGMRRIEAYRDARIARDNLTQRLEGKHFDELINETRSEFKIKAPSGVTSADIPTELNRIEADVVKRSTLSETKTTRTLRHLSLFESPFRSCLGGTDCSTRTYPTKALDPNYHYFTITNDQGESTGHITVVLGDGKVDGKSVKVAFVDKVQNVDHQTLLIMTEGVRRTVAEKGYRLVVPEDVGNHDGISNEESTRRFMAKKVQRDKGRKVKDFKPHGHDYFFPNRYSRADDKLPSREVLALQRSDETKLTPGNVDNPWRTQDENLNLDAIVKNSWNLKDSSKIDDQLKYLKAQESLRSAGLQVDPDLNKTLSRWITDQAHHQQVRKAAAIFEWQVNRKPLNQVLEQLPKEIRDQLVDQIQQTNRLKDSLLQEANSLPDYASRIIDKFLRDKDPEVSRNAASALKSYQGPDAPELFNLALSNKDPEVRSNAASALEVYRGPSARELFKLALSDSDSRVRKSVASVLAAYQGSDAQALFKLALSDMNPWVRINAASALGGYQGPGAQELFKLALSDKDAQVRSNAASALETYQGPGAQELFKLALSDRDPRVRESAASALGGYRGPDAPELFKNAFSDMDIQVRNYAASALGGYRGPDAPEVFNLALSDENPRVRESAALALGRYRGPEAPALFKRVFSDKDPDLRNYAASALRFYQGPDASALFKLALSVMDTQVRISVASALGGYRGPGAQELFELALSDSESRVRSNAASALVFYQGSDAHTLFRLALSDKDTQVRSSAASALKSYQGPDAPALFKLALSDEIQRVRDIATSTLKAYQGSDAPDLFKSLLSDTDPRVSQAARAALNQSVVRGDQTIEDFLNCSASL